MEDSKIYSEICARFAKKMGVGRAMDAKHGTLIIGGRRADIFYLEGFLYKQALERVTAQATSLDTDVWKNVDSAEDFLKRYLIFAECVKVSETDALLRALSGFLVITFEGFHGEWFAIEARMTPQRAIQEPSKGKTLRGPHEGFCENIVTNIALLRRRLKTPKLSIREFVLGDYTQTRVAMCFIEGICPRKLVQDTANKLQSTVKKSVCMGEESVTELLFYQRKGSFLNPLPRTRFTERPDTCAAELLEGKVILLIDTTPSAIILPMTLFEFFEECDNYYFPPLTASYLRIVRFLCFVASVFLVPSWLLAINNGANIPESFSFLLVSDPYSVPIFLQLLLIEFAIDGLKLASLNTPEPLANSLSVVGGLLLGDFAVKSGWFVPQTILYSAIVTILNFIPNNYELGYSLKFWRVLLIILVEMFGTWGLVGGSVIILILLWRMRDAAGRGYLYPFLPFDAKAIAKMFVKTTRGRESKK